MTVRGSVSIAFTEARLAGFAAATFRRGVPWLAVPSTLVGQVDAAIGGKTAINVAAKNDVVSRAVELEIAYELTPGSGPVCGELFGFDEVERAVSFAVAKNRQVMGATNPEKADAGTIRKEFATNIERNAVHGSDAAETAKEEIAFFFSTAELAALAR